MTTTRINIREILEQWARWRRYRASGDLGYPRKTILGKILDGLPSTTCTLCHGAKRVAGNRVGADARWVTCPQCSGEGKIKADPDGVKVNPAFIRSTASPAGYDDDPQSQHVDWLVCVKLTEYQRSVLLIEYTHNGTQEMKATREGISHSYYSRTLRDAIRGVEDGMIEWMRWPDSKKSA